MRGKTQSVPMERRGTILDFFYPQNVPDGTWKLRLAHMFYPDDVVESVGKTKKRVTTGMIIVKMIKQASYLLEQSRLQNLKR